MAMIPQQPDRPEAILRLRPELLQSPNIPKPLHGVNPRTIRGSGWWEKTRKEAYAKNNHHCHCCGVYRNDAKHHSWLEAHEVYSYDYSDCSAEFIEVVALCHSCHNFIHSGRLFKLFEQGSITDMKFNSILNHGVRILWEFGLPPYFGTVQLLKAAGKRFHKGLIKENIDMRSWSRWHLNLDGSKYSTPFASYEEHAAHYANGRAK